MDTIDTKKPIATVTAITPTREENFPEWYQQVVKKAKLAENSLTRGCMVILPNGMALWEKIQFFLNKKIKETGHSNMYFPLLIPLSLLQQEANHVEGFSKECAVVTHRRLIQKESGELVPDGQLAEPYIIRPTSEMIIGEWFSKNIQSYRDLPLKINQWANVMRWEMRPRVFLRTAEFLWQEGHTVHSTSQEAMEEVKTMLHAYEDLMENFLALPVVLGEKTESERFPGADKTFTLEVMMQDGKALQAGTSHYLGQNFSKAQNIIFTNTQEKQEHAYTTSWGVSSRLIGGMVMAHADDNGMILPPAIAETQIFILPIIRKEEEREGVKQYIEDLVEELRTLVFRKHPLGVVVDWKEGRGGEKYWDAIKQGFPLIVEIGPKDKQKNQVCFTKRVDGPGKKSFLERGDFLKQVCNFLEQSQAFLFEKAKKQLETNVKTVSSRMDLENLFKKEECFPLQWALGNIVDCPETQQFLEEYKLTLRCIPFKGLDILKTLNAKREETLNTSSLCCISGKSGAVPVLIAKSY